MPFSIDFEININEQQLTLIYLLGIQFDWIYSWFTVNYFSKQNIFYLLYEKLESFRLGPSVWAPWSTWSNCPLDDPKPYLLGPRLEVFCIACNKSNVIIVQVWTGTNPVGFWEILNCIQSTQKITSTNVEHSSYT